MPTASVSFIIHFARVSNLAIHHNVGTCLRHVSMQSAIVSTPWKHATNHKPKGRFFWFVYAKGIPKEPSLWFVARALLCHFIDGEWCRALPWGARVCGGQGFCSPHDCVPQASRLPQAWWLVPFWWRLALPWQAPRWWVLPWWLA